MDSKTCRNILYWVERNIYTGASIAQLVDVIGMSRRTLEVKFRQNYGISLGAYIFRRKMTRAAVTLKFSRLPITEIAIGLHYHSGQSFSRAFQRFFGKSPTAYRNEITWNTHILQFTFLYALPDFRAEIIFWDEPRFIAGNKINYKARTDIDDRSFIDNIRGYANEHLNNDADSILVTTSINDISCITTSRDDLVCVEATVGITVENEEECSMTIPKGQYAMFSFHGSWEDYYLFSKLIFIKSLAEHDLQWANNTSILNIHSLCNENHKIHCDMYIPILKI